MPSKEDLRQSFDGVMEIIINKEDKHYCNDWFNELIAILFPKREEIPFFEGDIKPFTGAEIAFLYITWPNMIHYLFKNIMLEFFEHKYHIKAILQKGKWLHDSINITTNLVLSIVQTQGLWKEGSNDIKTSFDFYIGDSGVLNRNKIAHDTLKIYRYRANESRDIHKRHIGAILEFLCDLCANIKLYSLA